MSCVDDPSHLKLTSYWCIWYTDGWICRWSGELSHCRGMSKPHFCSPFARWKPASWPTAGWSNMSKWQHEVIRWSIPTATSIGSHGFSWMVVGPCKKSWWDSVPSLWRQNQPSPGTFEHVWNSKSQCSEEVIGPDTSASPYSCFGVHLSVNNASLVQVLTPWGICNWQKQPQKILLHGASIAVARWKAATFDDWAGRGQPRCFEAAAANPAEISRATKPWRCESLRCQSQQNQILSGFGGAREDSGLSIFEVGGSSWRHHTLQARWPRWQVLPHFMWLSRQGTGWQLTNLTLQHLAFS